MTPQGIRHLCAGLREAADEYPTAREVADALATVHGWLSGRLVLEECEAAADACDDEPFAWLSAWDESGQR